MKNKFVNLHAHSVYSIGDGLGMPSQHIDFAIKNGLEAHAFTDHGNMSNIANAELHMRKIRETNPDFKIIRGNEMYFHPSISDWHSQREKFKEQEIKEEDSETTTIVEDEDETKESSKTKKPKNESQKILRQRGHLVVLAKNKIGLQNLYALTSKSYHKDNFYFYPRVDFEMLKKHSEGLIVSSACLGSALNTFSGFWPWLRDGIGNEADVLKKQEEMCSKFYQIFKENFFLELQWNAIPEQHLLNKNLIDISKKLGIPLISTADCHYPDPKVWKEREVYKKLAQLNKTKEPTLEDIPNKLSDMKYELFPKNFEQMIEAYERYSKQCDFYYDDNLIHESIQRAGWLADQVENYKLDNKIEIPNCFTPSGKTSTQHLKDICIQGLKVKNKESNKDYLERLEYEIDVIDKRGMSDYFLTMKQIVDFAAKTSLPSIARGSAGGSLISYLAGITQLDPIRFDLQFERFITVDDPTSFPDIDTDFEDPGKLREDLTREWKEEYNLDVIPISNYTSFKVKSLLKDLSRLLSIPFQEVNEVTNKIFSEASKPAKIKHDIETGMYEPTYQDCIEFSPSFNQFLKKYPVLSQYFEEIAGNLKNCSRHAAGVIVLENAFEKLPLIATKGEYQTPFTEGQRVRELEPLGFLKLDLLGLATLKMIHRCIELILEEKLGRMPSNDECKDWYNENLHPDVLDLDNKKVYENVFEDGKWIGIFQFSQRPVQSFAKRVKPKNINELCDVTSIFRPGPLAANVDQKYLSEETSETLKNSKLKSVFAKSKGHLIYQETIAKYANEIGDFSLADGNKLRKLLTKKGIGDTKEKLDKFKKQILEKGQQKGIPKYLLDSIWSDLERSSQYLFNRCIEENVLVEKEDGTVLKIKDVEVGNKINSKNGFVEIVNKYDNGTKDLYEVELENGKIIKVTLDHKFETNFGMLPLSEILSSEKEIYILCK